MCSLDAVVVSCSRVGGSCCLGLVVSLLVVVLVQPSGLVVPKVLVREHVGSLREHRKSFGMLMLCGCGWWSWEEGVVVVVGIRSVGSLAEGRSLR